ncbi:polysaccharide biosynthesis tyrosine autokinase [bacterium]|nr:polysaccharide biosynthesis tyrosine autokinase [bacterium]MBU1984721.1 polysaccharide biosynthesis tyrosine autokinase [bacterium]
MVVSFLAVVGSVTFLTYRMQPEYFSTASILILNRDQVEETVLNERPLPVTKSRNLNAIQILKSRRIAEDVVRSLAESPYRNELELMKREDAKGRPITFDERVELLRDRTSVRLVQDTDVLQVSVRAHSPFEAAFLTNALAEQFYRYSLQSARGEISDVRQFLEQQLQVVREQLSQSEEIERSYKESQGVSSLDRETAQLVDQSAEFHALYNTTQTELNAQLRRQEFLRKQLAQTKGAMYEDLSSASNPLITSLQDGIATKQTKIATLLANPGPGTDVTVAAIEKEVEVLKARLIEEVRKLAGGSETAVNPLKTSQDLFDQLLNAEVEVRSLTAKSEALREVMETIDQQLEQLPQTTLVLARLTRDRELNEKLYLMLNEKYEEARIAEAGKSAGVQIIDTAKPPEFPVRPKKKLNILLGMLFGLAIGVGIAFFLEFLDDTIKTGEDIERLKLTLLGTIPLVRTEHLIRRLKKEGRPFSPADLHRVESRMITRFSPRSPVSEAYRSLRTNIQFADIDTPKRVLLMTSTTSKEGKSTTAVNLAITLAQMGSRVLLIDSDLRRPALHNFFSMDKTYGVTNALIGSLSFDDVVKQTGVDKLDVITSGDIPPNPAELVASENMKRFIEEARSRYDYVILDSPPVIAVTDAAVLATRVDGAILVVSSGTVSRREVQRGISLLQNVGSGILGVVLNALDIKKIYGSYYYYFHYYQYYYYYGSEPSKRGKRKTVKPEYQEAT